MIKVKSVSDGGLVIGVALMSIGAKIRRPPLTPSRGTVCLLVVFPRYLSDNCEIAEKQTHGKRKYDTQKSA